MVTLTGHREIGGVDVFRDDVDPLSWYILPQAPRVALDEQGKPVFSMVWYRRDLSRLTEEQRRTALGGGILTMSVELSVNADEEGAIRKALAADPDLHARLASPGDDMGGRDYRSWWFGEADRDAEKLGKALKLSTVPVLEGTVGIAVLGETGAAGSEFASNLVGAGKVSMAGRQRASFMVKLTMDGAVLLWEMLERNLAAIRVGYELNFQHRLDAVRMVVHCDADKSYKLTQELEAHLSETATFHTQSSGGSWSGWAEHSASQDYLDKLTEELIAAEAAYVHIFPEDKITPEVEKTLVEKGFEMLQSFIASNMLTYDPTGGADPATFPEGGLATSLPVYDGKKFGSDRVDYDLKKDWDREAHANLHFDLVSKSVIAGTLGPNDNLSSMLDGWDIEQFRTQIELDADFYKTLDLSLVCTADFESDPVDLVKVHVEYDETGDDGQRVYKVEDFEFSKGATPAHFLTYVASREKRSYKYGCTVYYRGGNATWSFSGHSNETILVLDTDAVGVLRVDVQMGVIDWNQIRDVIVRMKYGAGPTYRETQFKLTQETQNYSWVEGIGASIDTPYTYEVEYVTHENQRLPMLPATARSKQLLLSQPLQENLEVTLVPVGKFGGGAELARVAVALRYLDEANHYVVEDTFILGGSEKNEIWKVPLRNKDLRSYFYQVKAIYSDGVERADAWKHTDELLLTVGDPFQHKVEIAPYLLKNPHGKWAFGIVNLSYDDPETGVHAVATFDVQPPYATKLPWTFRLGNTSNRTYTYQLTLYRAEDNGEVVMPAVRDDKTVLVLKGP